MDSPLSSGFDFTKFPPNIQTFFPRHAANGLKKPPKKTIFKVGHDSLSGKKWAHFIIYFYEL